MPCWFSFWLDFPPGPQPQRQPRLLSGSSASTWPLQVAPGGCFLPPLPGCPRWSARGLGLAGRSGAPFPALESFGWRTGMGSQGSSLHRGEKEVSPEKLQQLRKVLRKNFPPRVHGLEDVPGAVPAPRCRQGSPVAVPASPAHTAQLLLFPVDLFFFSDAAADHFSPILPPSPLCWVAGPSHPRCLPLPRGNPGSCPHLPGDGPSHCSGGEPGEGGDEGWDGLLRMFLIPKAVTSVRVGLPTQALFIQSGGPCSSSEAGSARCGGMDRGGGGAVTSWVAGTPSEAEEGSVVLWRDQNSDDRF